MFEVSLMKKQKKSRLISISTCLDLILGTFRIEGAQLFWTMMTRLQLESHPIVCWKFCYVIHRILRDGHKNVSDYRWFERFH